MERDKKRQTDRHMTTDLGCQEFQKRGERKRKRDRRRETEREREKHPTDVYASLFVLFHSHSVLSSCSRFTCGSLSLSLSFSLFVCVCTNVDVYSYVVLYSSLSPLFLSLSHRHTHTQWNRAKLSMSSNY